MLVNPEIETALYQIVKSYIIHGLCGVLNTNLPCIKDIQCSKKVSVKVCQGQKTRSPGSK